MESNTVWHFVRRSDNTSNSLNLLKILISNFDSNLLSWRWCVSRLYRLELHNYYFIERERLKKSRSQRNFNSGFEERRNAAKHFIRQVSHSSKLAALLRLNIENVSTMSWIWKRVIRDNRHRSLTGTDTIFYRPWKNER